MNSERRQHPRFILGGVSATLTINFLPVGQLQITGEILDLSYSGIKIQLDSPLAAALDGQQIMIQLKLPESGIPLTIKGLVRHQQSPSELGLRYDEPVAADYLDEFIFECTKSPRQNLAGSVNLKK